jgi:anaerobic magnesium-protoporphyrin IX monomethyl ester cyclase
VQLRPSALRLFNRDPDQAHAMRWYTAIGRRVWFHEVAEFMFRRRHFKVPPLLETFAGKSMAGEEYAMVLPRTSRPATPILPVVASRAAGQPDRCVAAALLAS